MRKNLAILLLSFSLILLLGHSLLPHNHLAEDEKDFKISEIENHCFTDILKFTLSSDLGVNHLKNFNRNDFNNLINFSNANFFNSSNIDFFSIDSTSFDGQTLFAVSDFQIKSQALLYSKGLRAPPSRA